MTIFLVVDDEPDLEVLFRQQFRRDIRSQRFVMEFAGSAAQALTRIADIGEQTLILILSDINMPGMSGLEMLPEARARRPDVPVIMMRCRDAQASAGTRRRRPLDQAD
jgi:CheY-like chemotaxis protein